MERIINARGTHKTRQLMEYAAQEEAIFVCKNPMAMARKAHDYGIFGLQFMSYNELIPINRKFVVDELEEFVIAKTTDENFSTFVNFIGYNLTNED